MFIPGQTLALGQYTFGPELSRYYERTSGSSYEPHVALSGVWTFEHPDGEPLDSLTATHRAFHAKARVGMLYRSRSGRSLMVIGTYDGIGTKSFESLGARVWLTIPLN